MSFTKKITEKAARRLTIIFAAIGVLLIAAAVCIHFMGGSAYSVTTYSMGSYVQQTLYGAGGEECAAEAANAIARLEDLISWRRTDSDIANLNDKAGADFISISGETAEILRTSLSVCEASGGAFDITIGPVSRLWSFDEEPAVPEEDLLALALEGVDYTAVTVRDDDTCALQSHGMSLDLGAVGKGAACDAAVAVYREQGLSHGIIAVGGSVGLYGTKAFNAPWEIAVRNPEGDGSLGTLLLLEGFVSTSGSYEKQFTQEGKTYHHLLNPKTGYPAESGLVSVTVVSESGALSDALSTACFVLGAEESLPLLDEFNAQGILVTEQGEVLVTSGLEGSFTLSAQGYEVSILPEGD